MGIGAVFFDLAVDAEVAGRSRVFGASDGDRHDHERLIPLHDIDHLTSERDFDLHGRRV